MTDGVIISIGSINADFQMRTPHPLQAGETLLATDFVRLSGGKAANVAFMAHRLGHRAILIGRIGDDELGEQALANLRQEGVSLKYVSCAEKTPTAVAIITVPPNGKKSIILANNANDAWDRKAAEAARSAILNAPHGSVLVADYEASPPIVDMCIYAARERRFRVVVDPAPTLRISRQIFPLCDALTPNSREAGELTRDDATTVEGAVRAALAIRAKGVPMVCVKLENGGCVLAEGANLFHIPAFPVNVVDATGAGDAFTCAFATALLEDHSPLQAALFGTAAAHLAVTGYGSQESYPTRGEINAFQSRLEIIRLPGDRLP